MTMYLGLLQLSADEATRMVERGVQERYEFLQLLVREAGGTMEGFWLTDIGEWDVVCLVRMGMTAESSSEGQSVPAMGAAATLARRAAGLTRREQWIALADVADVDTAMEQLRAHV
jgi:hypothetical protein